MKSANTKSPNGKILQSVNVEFSQLPPVQVSSK